jgi:pyruvate-ferredoxin/flavodoxin oxidoreductase
VLAYSTCIAHGIEMSTSMAHQKAAVTSGYWPLYRFHPSPDARRPPVQPRQQAPTTRWSTSSTRRPATRPSSAPTTSAPQHLTALAQADVDERWHYYEQLAGVERSLSAEPDEELGHS